MSLLVNEILHKLYDTRSRQCGNFILFFERETPQFWYIRYWVQPV